MCVGCALQTKPGSSAAISVRKALASSLLDDPKVGLANFHVSGRHDSATAIDNIRHAAAGRRSHRSRYQRAPGGAIYLDTRMLRTLKILAREGYSFRVTELAIDS